LGEEKRAGCPRKGWAPSAPVVLCAKTPKGILARNSEFKKSKKRGEIKGGQTSEKEKGPGGEQQNIRVIQKKT